MASVSEAGGNCKSKEKSGGALGAMDGYLRVRRAIANLSSGYALGELAKFKWERGGESEDASQDSTNTDDDCDGEKTGKAKSSAKKGEDARVREPRWRDLEEQFGKLASSAPYAMIVDGERPVDETLFTVNGKPLPTSAEDLLPLCKPSPFGDLRTNTTKIDESVRRAGEIDASRIDLTPAGILLMDDLAERASMALFGGHPIRLQVQKLNVYGPGGFFAPHVDTPRPGLVGTVLLELDQYKRVGGSLTIDPTPSESATIGPPEPSLFSDARNDEEDDYDVRWAWKRFKTAHPSNQPAHPAEQPSSASGSDAKTSRLTEYWRATVFYGHLPHHVTPVQSGHRVSLSFYALRDDAKPPAKPATTDRTAGPTAARADAPATGAAATAAAAACGPGASPDMASGKDADAPASKEGSKEESSGGKAAADNGAAAAGASAAAAAAAVSAAAVGQKRKRATLSTLWMKERCAMINGWRSRFQFHSTGVPFNAGISAECFPDIDRFVALLTPSFRRPGKSPPAKKQSTENGPSAPAIDPKALPSAAGVTLNDKTASDDNSASDDKLGSDGQPGSPSSEDEDWSGSVGLLFQNKYSTDELASRHWKGLDAYLMRRIERETTWRVEILPVVVKHDESWRPEENSRSDSRSQCVYRFTEADIAFLSALSKDVDDESPRRRVRSRFGGDDPETTCDGPEDVTFIGAGHWTLLQSRYQDDAAHTGNESRDGELENRYFSVAAILRPTN